MLEIYQARRQQRQAAADVLAAQDRRISNFRLAMFGLVFGVLYMATRADLFSAAWTLVPVGGYVALMLRHQRVLDALDRVRRALTFYDQGLGRLTETWRGQGLQGPAYLEAAHPYAGDLDVFGPNSLYELLCTARTQPGQNRLASWLQGPASAVVVRERQAAVADLRDRLDLREALAVVSQGTGLLPEDRMLTWSENPPKLLGWGLRVLGLLLGVATLGALGAWLMTGDPRPLAVLVIVETLVLRGPAAAVGDLEKEVAPLADLQTLLGFLQRLERETFQAPLLQRLTAPLADRPSVHVDRLLRLTQWLDAPRNPFFAPLGYMMMWTLQFAHEVDGWRAAHGSKVRTWLTVVADMEALLALANLAAERPEDVFPEVLDDGCLWEAEGIGHPLIPAASCVRNDVTLSPQQQLYIVSGSNMSGKSSLLRTVGTNTVLALAGAPVRATRLKLSPVSVGASLLVADSLAEGVSRFYAEIRRLRQIVDMGGKQPPLLFLLDEMLQGTNSYDRAIGATAVLQALVERGAIGLVTTHDLNLTHIAEKLEGRAINVHFEDHLEDGQMKFDYHLRTGVVEKSNAVALMRAIGLPV